MMSPGAYPFPPATSTSNILQPRRTSGTLPLSYDRPPAPPSRRSPSPGASRRFSAYEGYTAPRSAPPYRDGFSAYHQNAYRPDSHSYYSRSQSPDRPHGSARDMEWDRSTPWQPPNQTPWPDRRALTLSPTSSVISRDRVRSDPTAVPRMFEPSDTWKQTQGDRPVGVQSPKSSPVERNGDRMRTFRDHTPERPVHGRSPHYARGDRYRPDQNVRGTGRLNSYRPSYDGPRTARQTSSSYRPNSDLGGRYYNSPPRRASSPNGSISSSRSRRSWSTSRSRSISRSRSRSGLRTSAANPRHSPERGRRSTSRYTGSDRLGRRRTKSRSASRSSIASTQASDHPPPRPVSPVTLPTPSNPAVNGTSGNDHDLQMLSPSPHSGASSSVGSSPHSRSASVASSSNSADDAHPPPPSDGMHMLRKKAYHKAKRQKKRQLAALERIAVANDAHADNSQQHRSESPLQAPGLGNDTRATDVEVPSTKVEQQPGEHLSLPLTEETPGGQPEITAHPKTTLPTWDVVPTLPEPTEPTVLDRAPSPAPLSPVSPSPIPVHVPEPVPVPPPEEIIPNQPQIDYTFEDIPRLADAKCIEDALRSVVMTRLLRDQQTRDERVNPILMENLSIAVPPAEYTTKTQDQLIEEISVQRFTHSSDDPFFAAKSWLSARFDKRRAALSEKSQRLQLEYQALHKRWRRHCASLNEQSRPVESDNNNNVPVSGRTTRRTAANLGDTVRSDLEMEQIIASLGYDEAMDPNQLSTRNLAVIPDMISVTGQTQYTFDDTNHLVENPNEYYAPYTGIHDWTEPEKEMFLDKYAAFPKQFGVIAEFLPNKTASQCVDYYYLHKKKLIDFRRVVSQFAPNKRRRRRTGKQKGNGLLSDIRQHDAEVNGDADDSPSFSGRPTRGRRVLPEARKTSVRRNPLHLEGTTTGTPTPEPEARPKRRRVAVSRSVLFQDDLDEDTDGEPKKKKRGRKPKSATVVVDDFITPAPTPPIMDIDLGLPAPIQWSSEDKALFLDLLAEHGDNFKRIAVAMPDKTTVQVAEYFQANLVELQLGSIIAKALPISTVDQPGDASISGRTSPIAIAVSSAPSPSASAVPPQGTSSLPTNDLPSVNGSAEPGSQPPQNDEATPLDPNQMWESMDPGSSAQSPTTAEPPERPLSPGPDNSSSDLSVISAVPDAVPVYVSKSAPPMASLTREPPVSETNPAISTETGTPHRSPLLSLKIPKYPPDSAASAGPSASQDHTATSRPEASEKNTLPQASSSEPKFSAPVMSSLAFDPTTSTWAGYYDPNGLHRPMLPPPNRYVDNSMPSRPYSPSQPVPYAAPLHLPPRPPVGAISSRPPPMMPGPFTMHPYYIPPPYPSTSYHPYGSYKS